MVELSFNNYNTLITLVAKLHVLLGLLACWIKSGFLNPKCLSQSIITKLNYIFDRKWLKQEGVGGTGGSFGGAIFYLKPIELVTARIFLFHSRCDNLL
jgi:hypothetical protein